MTLTVEDGTREKLISLAGGERKIGAKLDDLVAEEYTRQTVTLETLLYRVVAMEKLIERVKAARALVERVKAIEILVDELKNERGVIAQEKR